MGAQAWQARATGTRAGDAGVPAFHRARRAFTLRGIDALPHHARRRHGLAAGPPARTRRHRSPPFEPAAHRPTAPRCHRRLRNPAAARRDALAAARAGDLVPPPLQRSVRHRRLQPGHVRDLPGPLRRRQLHRQRLDERCRCARHAGRAPARRTSAQPRPARRLDRALRWRQRRHHRRGGTHALRRGRVASAPLDARRLAVAAIPHRPAARAAGAHPALEDGRQPAPVARCASRLRLAVGVCGMRGRAAGIGVPVGGGGLQRRAAAGRRGRTGPEPRRHRFAPLLSSRPDRPGTRGDGRGVAWCTAAAAGPALPRRHRARLLAPGGVAPASAAVDDGRGSAITGAQRLAGPGAAALAHAARRGAHRCHRQWRRTVGHGHQLAAARTLAVVVVGHGRLDLAGQPRTPFAAARASQSC